MKKFQADEKPLVSILVPIYNVAEFLPQCLDSLVGQTLKNIQIICINDGSTDNSLEIVKSYAEQDGRIDIIDKPNSGYGASMNCGLDIARGEYVGITESDDYADRTMFKKLYRAAKKYEADLVKSNYYEFTSNTKETITLFDEYPYKRVFNPADYPHIITSVSVIWTGLYRREMLLEEGIRFNETPGASFQDTSFVQRVWFAARRVVLLPKAFLNYRVDNSGSSVKSSAKVYEVCGEFALSEEFLRKTPDRFSAFMPMLNRQKLDVYRWNYNRISEECRLDFVKKWAAEMKASAAEGMLKQDCFDEYNWGIVQELITDPQAFFEKYHEAL